MNIRDTKYARYITIGGCALLVTIVGFWLYHSMPRTPQNTNPRIDFVCMDTSCTVRKKCATTTLIIYTTVPGQAEPAQQRVSNSYECQQG